MKMNRLLSTGIIAGTVGFLALSPALAAETIGTVVGEDGDVKDKVAITAEITSVDGSEVTFKDVDTGEEYDASFGPTWYTEEEYAEGDRVDVIGVETEGEGSEEDHNFQVMEVDDTVLREEFEGKPKWAGSRGGGNGDGTGAGTGSQNKGANRGVGSSFVDGNGDGVCDNLD